MKDRSEHGCEDGGDDNGPHTPVHRLVEVKVSTPRQR